jgi:hypothetical protein
MKGQLGRHTRRKAAGDDFICPFFAWIARGDRVDSWSGILEGRRRVTTSSVLSFLPGSRAASTWTRGRSAGDYVARAVFFKSLIRNSTTVVSVYICTHTHSTHTHLTHTTYVQINLQLHSDF